MVVLGGWLAVSDRERGCGWAVKDHVTYPVHATPSVLTRRTLCPPGRAADSGDEGISAVRPLLL